MSIFIKDLLYININIGNSCCTQYFYFANNCVDTWDIVKTS